MSPAFLNIERVTLRFGGLKALQDVSVSIRRGEILSIIGPNGAGKTSFFNVLTGIYHPSEGSVSFLGQSTAGKPTRTETTTSALVGFAVGLMLLIAVNIEQLWAAAVTSLYVYRRPFPWGRSLESLLTTISSMPLYYSLLPFCFGVAVGASAAALLWKRTRRSPYAVAARGITRTFQNIRLFHQLSALDNVLIGLDLRLKTTFFDAALRLPRHRAEVLRGTELAHEILEFVGLGERAERIASTLSYGHQRRLEIARALASSPQVLLLDEPAAGTNPAEAADLMELIRKIRERGVSVVLIEHQMKVVMGISDRIAVLDYGIKIAEGTPAEIRADPKVIKAYLGTEEL